MITEADRLAIRTICLLCNKPTPFAHAYPVLLIGSCYTSITSLICPWCAARLSTKTPPTHTRRINTTTKVHFRERCWTIFPNYPTLNDKDLDP
jgi:hypothetical protein